jgi:hypothetical protein
VAHCVISAVMDTDDMAASPACVVHTNWAPCPHDGQPACPEALHALPGMGTSRSDALRMWKIRTHRQRPLVIHRVDGRPADEHDIDGTGCLCGPELFPPEGG